MNVTAPPALPLGVTSKSISNCCDSASHCRSPWRTATSGPTAEMRRPVSGTSSGSWRRSCTRAFTTLRGGILLASSWSAVRSSITSWNENRYSLRGPRAGVTKPASIRRVSVPADKPSISRTLFKE